MKILRFFQFLLRSLYQWTARWVNTRYAAWSLFIIAFAESSFFPVPPDVLLIPMTILKPFKWWRYALLATAASVLGGILGYFLGFGFYQTIGRQIVDLYGLRGAVDVLGLRYADNAFLAVFAAAFTPIPYKVITISAGLFQINLGTMIFASLVGRGARFFAVSLLLRIFGEKIRILIEKYFNALSLIFLGLLIGGFIFIKFLF